MSKRVYLFNEGSADMRNLLGGKGANLAEMTNIGLPIPNGFTISTEACTDYYNDGKTINEDTQAQIFKALEWLEGVQGKKFGDTENPLLVSVRSGARASMPGMMDTILNLGLNDVSVKGFAAKTGNPRFAYDSYRRFIQMFSDVVMGMSKTFFDSILEAEKKAHGYVYDTELKAEDLQNVIAKYKEIYAEKMGEEFPQDPKVQLMEAIKAVFRSWDNPRANYYRMMNDIPYEWGTAVNVQSMVFGKVSVLLSRSHSLRRIFPSATSSSSRSLTDLRSITATCRIWSSPSRMANCTSCRPETAREPLRPLSRSHAIWLMKA